MAEGRLASEWNQTAELLCVLYNVNRDTQKRKDPFTAEDFNPFAVRTKPSVPKLKDLSILKQLFVDRPMPKGT